MWKFLPLALCLTLLDPDRLQWEVDLVYAYGVCAGRHRAAIKAWGDAAQSPEK